MGDERAVEERERGGRWKSPPGRWAAPAGPAEREEFWDAFRACLGRLPPRLGDAFALRYLDEAAGPDICRELGLTDANLWVTLHRARLRLWKCLSDGWFGGEPPGGA